MRIIGLTGSIATGKSTVSRCLSEHGLPIVDADLIAREVVAPGQPANRRIVKALGAENVLDPNGTGAIDRPRLASLVFRDPSVRRKVNSATHPYIRLEMLRQLLWAFLCLKRVVILDTPLLFEAEIDKWVHVVMVVYW
jgi:dephospho-CoA kinase